MNTVSFNGKQDDIFFVDTERGWYANGQGFIYKTGDGGGTWTEQLHQTGTYFRALGFVDDLHGYAGNIGPDYFPGVSDKNPLYETRDGGVSWTPVRDVSGAQIKGVCSIDILKKRFINAGQLDTRITIRAAGRVGGPTAMATSRDGGRSWTTQDLSSVAGMILDVKFLNEQVGFLCAGSDADVGRSHARILKTNDGGDHWRVVYESKRPFELIWKCSFPSEQVGYATVQSYDPDEKASARLIAKTTDGGETWAEMPLVNDFKVREFGIGFVDEQTGWVGAIDGGWITTDGGQTWSRQEMGKAVNKIRIVPGPQGPVVYSIGFDVRKLDLRNSRAYRRPPSP